MDASLEPKATSLSMLAKRLLVSVILLPVGLVVIVIGGPVYAAFVTLILGLAAWEYVQIFRAGGFQPAGVLVVGGTVLLALARFWDGFDSAPWMLSLLILATMAFHLLAYERGSDQSGTEFGITLGGLFYLGWIGAYLISLRELPDGRWWVFLAIPTVWLIDSGAYTVGVRFGRHKLSPRLSPKKSWEGYLGGIAWGVLGGAGLAAALQIAAGPGTAITPLRGALLGLFLGVLTLLGDLGESMFKRQMGVKDSGNILPGHGGMFDRIDSWLWAGVISFYMVVWLFP